LALGRPPRTERLLVPASVGHVSPRRRTHLVVAVGERRGREKRAGRERERGAERRLRAASTDSVR
jgi:hypothetical protein